MISRFETDRVVSQRRTDGEPGGVKLRVDNIQRMKAFYRDALGFSLTGELPNAALLEISATNEGGTQAIGLFKRPVPLGPEHKPVDRISFSVPFANFGSERRRLEQLGFRVDAIDPGRILIQDPEGNQVELICRDSEGR